MSQIAYDEDAHWAAERTKMEDASYEQWEREHADELYEEAYQAWREQRIEDEYEKFSRDDYVDAMEAALEPDE